MGKKLSLLCFVVFCCDIDESC